MDTYNNNYFYELLIIYFGPQFQKIKKRMTYNPSICDPDTSDEETESNRQRSMPKQQKVKRTKLTSPKPQRVTIFILQILLYSV